LAIPSTKSFVTPRSIFDYDVRTTRERSLRKQQPVLGGYDAAAIRQRATARHGFGWHACANFSIVQRRDTPRDGSAPLLLYGYGQLRNFRAGQFQLETGFMPAKSRRDLRTPVRAPFAAAANSGNLTVGHGRRAA